MVAENILRPRVIIAADGGALIELDRPYPGVSAELKRRIPTGDRCYDGKMRRWVIVPASAEIAIRIVRGFLPDVALMIGGAA